jgi:acetoacetate decarboxylase
MRWRRKADFPVREIIGCSHILTDLTLARAKRCYDYLDDIRVA